MGTYMYMNSSSQILLHIHFFLSEAGYLKIVNIPFGVTHLHICNHKTLHPEAAQ